MEIYVVEGSLTTPSVLLDPFKGIIELRGKSIPENCLDFYQPLYDWLAEYSQQPRPRTEVRLSMEYFNTSSSKEFIRFFRLLEGLHVMGKTQMEIKWYHEEDDEEMMEMGEGLKGDLKVPIEIVSIEEL